MDMQQIRGIFLYGVMLVFAPQLVVGIVNPTPSNTTAVVGEEVTLLCGYSGPDTFEWMEYITSQLGTGIFITPPDSQPPNAIKYRVDGSYNLVVLDLDVTDGGLYGCRSYDMGNHARAQLLVVEEPSLLIPESLVEMRSTQITCSVNYGGSTDSSTTQIPTMEIAMDGSPQTATIEHTPPVPGDPDTYVAGYLSATVNYTANRNDNGRNLTCEVKTEVPAFSVMSWETMEIRYPVENILLDPVKLDYYIGELINCSADGVPEPEYQWSPIESPAPRTVDGASLEILSNMVGFNQWECQASNTVENTEVMTVTIDFNVLNEDVSNESQALRAFSVVWLCVTSLLATIFCESRA